MERHSLLLTAATLAGAAAIGSLIAVLVARDPVAGAIYGLTLGLLACLPWYLLLTAYHAELERLTLRITASVQPTADDPESALRPLRYGLEELRAVVDTAHADARRRAHELQNQRRAIQLAARTNALDGHQLRSLLDTIPHPIVVTDPQDRVAMINAAAGRVLGVDPAAARLQPIERVVRDVALRGAGRGRAGAAGGHDLANRNLARTARQTRESAGTAPVRGDDPRPPRRPEGEAFHEPNLYIDINATATLTAPPRTTLTGVALMLRDITRERAILESKTDFVSRVSHELRTPLAGIKGYLELLQDGEATDPAMHDQCLNVIHSEANRLERLIDNILNLSRIEAGMVRPQREPVVLAHVIQEAVDVLHRRRRPNGSTS